MILTPLAITIIGTAVLASSLAALYFNLRRDLMMLQQNSYRNDRYTRWFNSSQESTSYTRIGACIAAALLLVNNMPYIFTGPVAAVIMLWICGTLATRKYKKPLVMTRRAWRILLTQALLSLVTIALVGGLTRSLHYAGVAAVVVNIISPLYLLLANIILRPVEKHINNRYYREAAEILRSMPNLKIIGVTGSYGKTSTKHYLNRILAEKYSVMMTPGSFNTTLGVIRTIREYLQPYNEVFIVEMGAKQPGDIKEICDLVHPSIGIVTAVGEQHLESFKTIENIQRTKFELVDSLPADGLAVVNDDFEMSAKRPVANVECTRYAVRNTEHAAFRATDIVTDATGTTFTITGPATELRLHTHLVGECNISNLMGAVVVALYLGVEPQKIAYAVEKIEQVEHRLNMKRTPAGINIIDDAFNSNPTGSRMALEVLGSMTSGKRIVVTPGMIELGDRQEELNRELGRTAAANADIVIVVGQYNRDAITAGLADASFPEKNIHLAETFNEAQGILASIMSSGDTVLYENDLPDTFK